MKKLQDIKRGRRQVNSQVVEKLAGGLAEWLLAQAPDLGLTTLLAHADDGVIWGRVQGEKLITSHQVFETVSPPLRAETLQQARLFGPRAELLLWRVDAGWGVRVIKDESGEDGEYYDEAQLLWGNLWKQSSDGFTLVSEGRQELRHAPPVDLASGDFDGERHPLRLQVRHYLTTDPGTGLLRVALGRLVRVTGNGKEKER
jgi:CRISPR-associated protein (TIGR03984 family)